MISLPPAYKYAPVMLVVTVAAVAYSIVSSIEEDIDAPTSIGRIIDEAKRTAGDVKQALEKTVKLPAAKLAKQAKRLGDTFGESAPKPFTGELLSLLDEGRISRVGVLKPNGVVAVFNSYKEPDSKKLVLKLSVKKMGVGKNDERFASGVIDFAEPVNARSFQAIAIKLKSSGVKGFGLAALSKKGSLFLRWDFAYNSGFYERGAYRFQFSSFDLWEYNTITRKYTRLKKGLLPEKIDQIQVYLKADHLVDRKSGELWIQSLALQGDK